MPLPAHLPSGSRTGIVVSMLADFDEDVLLSPGLIWCSVGDAYKNPKKFLGSAWQIVIHTGCLNFERIPHLIKELASIIKLPVDAIYEEVDRDVIQQWARGSSGLRLRIPTQTDEMEEVAVMKRYDHGVPSMVDIVADNWRATEGDNAKLLECIRKYHPNAASTAPMSAKQALRLKGWTNDGYSPSEGQTESGSHEPLRGVNGRIAKSLNGNADHNNPIVQLLEGVHGSQTGSVADFLEELAENVTQLAQIARKLGENPAQMAMLIAAIKIQSQS